MSWVVVDHPLLVPHKVQLVLLEAFLREVLHAAVGHLAQSPGVAPGVVGADIPLDLLASGIIHNPGFFSTILAWSEPAGHSVTNTLGQLYCSALRPRA